MLSPINDVFPGVGECSGGVCAIDLPYLLKELPSSYGPRLSLPIILCKASLL